MTTLSSRIDPGAMSILAPWSDVMARTMRAKRQQNRTPACHEIIILLTRNNDHSSLEGHVRTKVNIALKSRIARGCGQSTIPFKDTPQDVLTVTER